MPLPILSSHSQPSPGDLVRFFHQTEARWVQHLAEPHALDVGTAYINSALAEVYEANHVRDAALPAGMSPQQAVEDVESFFAGRGVRCASWTMNPSADAAQTQPLLEHLLASGYRPVEAEILLLGAARRQEASDRPDLTIIPARASYRHARLIHEEAAAAWNIPQLAEAGMLHLDDPHYDALLALKDGNPAGFVGVLAVGETGRIDQVYVARAYRRQGIGRILLARALEICARSVFRHVMLSTGVSNAAALRLYGEFGFAPVGRMVSYFPPGLAPPES